MTPAEIKADAEDQRSDLRQYCRQCTDSQLENVYNDETKRANVEDAEYSGVAQTAKVFADEAEQELQRRGLR
jgi:hypothetical protein